MRNLLLITGAGASYDVVDWREGNVNFKYWPPLTRNLFKPILRNIENRDKFREIVVSECINDQLSKHPVANELGIEFATQYAGSDSEAELEKFLAERKNSKSPSLRRDFWAMPYYLRDLFFEISQKCIKSQIARSTNYKFLLNKLVRSNLYGEIIWLNLNYDLFADVAIKSFRGNEDFKNFDDYMDIEIEEGLKVSYTKPHGSVDWWYASKEFVFTKDTIKAGRVPDDFEKKVSSSELMVHKQLTGTMESHAYPAITAPMGEYNFIYKPHKECIMQDLDKIDDLLCIGFSALDKHILKLIKDNCPTFKRMQIVNGSGDSGEKAYHRMYEYYGSTGRMGVPIEHAVFDGGFTKFVKKGFSDWI